MIVAVRTSPIDALEGGMALFETKRRCRRLVNDSVFADRKLIRHDWRGSAMIHTPARAGGAMKSAPTMAAFGIHHANALVRGLLSQSREL